MKKNKKWALLAAIAMIAASLAALAACKPAKATIELVTPVAATYGADTFGVGDPLNVEGARIKATQGDSVKTIAVTADMVSDFDTQALGEHSYTITYAGGSVDVPYKVIETTPLSAFDYYYLGSEGKIADAILNKELCRNVAVGNLLDLSAEKIVVAGYIEGFPVTEIGFESSNGLSRSAAAEVLLPNSVVRIGARAMAEISNLKALTLPCNLTYIEENAFYGTPLETVEISSRVKFIGSGAFAGNHALTAAAIPASVLEIGAGIFKNCDKLTSLSVPFIGGNAETQTAVGYFFDGTNANLPESLVSFKVTGNMKEVKSGTFSNAEHIAEITLPASVTAAEANAFDNSGWLKRQDGLAVAGSVAVAYNGTANYVEIPAGVTTIGEEAFKNNSFIKAVSIPSNVTRVQQNAFASCPRLSSVTLAEGLKEIDANAFSGNSKITEISFPASLAKIGDYAFNSDKLETVTIPAGVESIGAYAFANNRLGADDYIEYSNVKFAENGVLTSVDSNAFANNSIHSFYLPETVKEYGAAILSGNGNISKLSVPFIGKDVFTSYKLNYLFASDTTTTGSNTSVPSSLNSIEITAAKSVADHAFYGITRSSGSFNVDLRYSGVTRIGDSAFEGSDVYSVHFPATLASLGGRAFYGCTDVTDIDLSETALVEIRESAFRGCTYLYGVKLPAETAVVGQNAFYGCTNLNGVSFNEGLEDIEDYAFYNCSSLSSATFPESLCKIGAYAFNGTSFRRVTLPALVASVGDYAFANNAKMICVITEGPDVVFGSGVAGNSYVALIYTDSYYNTGNFNGNMIESAENLDADGMLYGSNKTVAKRYVGTEDSYTLPANCTLYAQAFYGCTEVETVNLSAATSLSNVRAGCLENAKNVSTLVLSFVGSYNTSGSDYTYIGSLFNASNSSITANNGYSLKTVTLAVGSSTISSGAFSNITTLQTVSITGFATIGYSLSSSMFAGCTALANLTLPYATSSLRYYLDNGSASNAYPYLTQVTVTGVSNSSGKDVFGGIGSTFWSSNNYLNLTLGAYIDSITSVTNFNELKTLKLNHTERVVALPSTFVSYSGLKIYVPTDALRTQYRNDGYWSSNSSKIYTLA